MRGEIAGTKPKSEVCCSKIHAINKIQGCKFLASTGVSGQASA